MIFSDIEGVGTWSGAIWAKGKNWSMSVSLYEKVRNELIRIRQPLNKEPLFCRMVSCIDGEAPEWIDCPKNWEIA